MLLFPTILAPAGAQEFPHIEATKTVSPMKVGEGEAATVKIKLRGAGGMILTPVDVVLIIDKSGSMSGEKILKAKEAAVAFLEFLDEKDRAGLVSYSHEISTKPLAYMNAENKEALRLEIGSLAAGGRTNIYDAIVAANQILLEGPRENAPPVEVLLTDGLHNWPTVRPDSDFIALAEEAKAHDIIIYTIGLGKDVNEPLLKAIAETTGGKYYFAATPDELRAIYEEIGSKLAFAGTKIKVTERLPPYLAYGGDATKPPESISEEDGTVVLVWKVGHLKVGEEWEVTYTVTAQKAAEYDPDAIQTLVEYITAVGSSAVVNLPPGAIYHNIAITEQTVSPSTATKGELVNVSLTVENKGLVKDTFKLRTASDNLTLYEETVTLDTGESKTIKFAWNTSEVELGTFNIMSIADPANEIFETNETDNEALSQVQVRYVQTGSPALFFLLLLIMIVTSTAGGVGYLIKKVVKAGVKRACPACRAPLRYDKAARRWYCPRCRRYV